MSKIRLCITLSCFILCAIVAGAQQESTLPQVEVPIMPKSRAMSPTPPANAKGKTQKTTIGEGRAAVKTDEPSTAWDEENAMSGVYQAKVVTSFLFDAKTGILYAYRNGEFACNHQTMSGHVLQGIYTTGNQAGQPAGSGWYIVDLAAGDCGAKDPGVYGCRFNADGQRTACGVATINSQTGVVDFAVVRQNP